MKKEKITNTNKIPEERRIQVIEKSAKTVGKAVFYSILITLISFIPILFLTGQEKKLFSPLVLTKTFTMVGSAIVALFIVPMLLRTFVKGKLIPESKNPVSRFFITIYTPVLRICLKWKKAVIIFSVIIVAGSIPFVIKMGTEFMPPLDEGSILFMPVTLPDVSNTEVKRILQVQDKIIKSMPEVENVLGKAGRAYTATDNAPLSMIESIIILKPKSEWRPGMTKEKLIREMDDKVRIPGVSNGFTQPIVNRINMLSTGIRTDVGIKIFGDNLDTLYSISLAIEEALKGVDGLADLNTEQLTGGKYLDIKIRKEELGRYGLSVDDVNMIIESALGGMVLTQTVEGRERFSVNVRLAQSYREDLLDIERIPVQTRDYGVILLSSVAEIEINEGPPMISSENALLRGSVLFNVRGRDMGSVVKDAKERINKQFNKLPKGYFIEWSGQYENQIRAEQRLKIIIPIVLIIICFILYFHFKSIVEPIIVLSSLPIALIGGVYSLYFFGVNFSVAVAVGFIALAGVAMETGILMMVYLNEAVRRLVAEKGNSSDKIGQDDLEDAVFAGSVLRVRPKLMTVLADMMGLLPVLLATGAGSDVMRPITIPFIFGLITSTLFVLIVLPVIYLMVKERELNRNGKLKVLDIKE